MANSRFLASFNPSTFLTESSGWLRRWTVGTFKFDSRGQQMWAANNIAAALFLVSLSRFASCFGAKDKHHGLQWSRHTSLDKELLMWQRHNSVHDSPWLLMLMLTVADANLWYCTTSSGFDPLYNVIHSTCSQIIKQQKTRNGKKLINFLVFLLKRQNPGQKPDDWANQQEKNTDDQLQLCWSNTLTNSGVTFQFWKSST